MDKALIECVAKALFDHEQNRPFPPKLTNMTLYGQHPVTWEFINDPMFVKSCSDNYREAAITAIEAVQLYKHPDHITGDGKMVSTHNPYTAGIETYKNEWPIPPGTKLGKRPSKTSEER